ncbi:hypothetical protein [Emcibacter sp.]|uniref:hypothetical protein n=1 Tax=Emcibacter sp. TaxID=1979954 RepID=UPI002AA61FEC|nr:hypothetical protein [Emcibacter sp.]
MEYFIVGLQIDRHPKLELTESKFNNLKSARRALFSGLWIEEKYELLLSNFIEFEKQYLSLLTDDMIGGNIFGSSYLDQFNVRLELNRRLVNFLTSSRLYLDQVVQEVMKCVPENCDVKRTLQKYKSEEFDDNFEYRFMEALRNYVQHHGLPIHNLKGGVKADEDGHKQVHMKLFTSKEMLLNDDNFKKGVIEEMSDNVELRYAARVYIGCISRIHTKVRELISLKLDRSRELVQVALADYADLVSKNVNTIYLVHSPAEPILYEELSLFLDWDNVRVELTKKNRSLVNFQERYVSGKFDS